MFALSGRFLVRIFIFIMFKLKSQPSFKLFFSRLSQALMQANNFLDGGIGKLARGKITGEGVPGILNGLTGVINNLACGLLGPGFLPLILRNNNCSAGSLAPNTFESFEIFCKCINSNPCLTSAVISIGFSIKGLGDLRERVGKCCKNEVVSITVN